MCQNNGTGIVFKGSLSYYLFPTSLVPNSYQILLFSHYKGRNDELGTYLVGILNTYNTEILKFN